MLFIIITIMDDKKFKEELSKIAKWYTPIVKDGTNVLRKPMPNSQENPTLGPVIEELKPLLSECQSCSKICSQRCNHTLKLTSIDGRRQQRRWEHSCATCKKPLDPVTLKAKEKTKSNYMRAKEAAQRGEGPKRSYWWNEDIKPKE
jgi:hypothetical protein